MWIPAIVTTMGTITLYILQKIFYFDYEIIEISNEIKILNENIDKILQNQEILLNQQKEIELQAKQIENSKEWSNNVYFLVAVVGIVVVFGTTYYFYPDSFNFLFGSGADKGTDTINDTIIPNFSDNNTKVVLGQIDINTRKILEQINIKHQQSDSLTKSMANAIIIEAKITFTQLKNLVIKKLLNLR